MSVKVEGGGRGKGHSGEKVVPDSLILSRAGEPTQRQFYAWFAPGSSPVYLQLRGYMRDGIICGETEIGGHRSMVHDPEQVNAGLV